MDMLAAELTTHQIAFSLIQVGDGTADGTTVLWEAGAVIGAGLLLWHNRARLAQWAGTQVARAATGVGRGLWRFVSGRELWGRPRSNATTWRRGTVSTDWRWHPALQGRPAPGAALLKSVAAAPAGTAGPVGGRAAAWLQEAAERALRPREDGGSGEWLVSVARRVGQAWRSSVRARRNLVDGVLVLRDAGAAGVRSAGRWHMWPYAGRALARCGALALAWQGVHDPVGAVLSAYMASVALGMAYVTGEHGLGWWRPRDRTDDEIYLPALWLAMAPMLGLEDPRAAQDRQAALMHFLTQGAGGAPVLPAQAPTAQLMGEAELPPVPPAEDWILFPGDARKRDAEIILRLPITFVGTQGEQDTLDSLVNSRVPLGEWRSTWQLAGDHHWVVWRHPKPPAKRAELPRSVDWIASADPYRVMVGVGHDGPIWIDVETLTPHFGVSGETGRGKSTVLYIPVVHFRQNGWLVDIIDLKFDSMEETHGKSGVRNHTDVRSAVMAMAEFFVSMKSAQMARHTGHTVIPRVLVIDEFSSFMKAAYLWWMYGVKGKGKPAFHAWFQMILMQGRTGNHRIVLGAHQFAKEIFGDTETRDQVGTKIIVGPASDPKWVVTYGHAKRPDWDPEVKGRGVIGVTGGHVQEFQVAYITPQVAGYLDACPQAPEWFDRGEMAPWITAAGLEKAEAEAAVSSFLPGSELMGATSLRDDTVVWGTPSSDQVAGGFATGPVTPAATPSPAAPQAPAQPVAQAPADPADRWQQPVTYTVRQACEKGIIPTTYNGAKTLKSKTKDLVPFPDGAPGENGTEYTAEALQEWHRAASEARRTGGIPQQPKHLKSVA
ncbi:hypothetical protein ACIQI7_38545 [Kitasatospora sp. NPDC092039]|uniref:hypothetical protein n=1 Tax=Kitasatospora sp. NPDC092039 TaxID=3364086 RepID=UPI00382DE123